MGAGPQARVKCPWRLLLANITYLVTNNTREGALYISLTAILSTLLVLLLFRSSPTFRLFIIVGLHLEMGNIHTVGPNEALVISGVLYLFDQLFIVDRRAMGVGDGTGTDMGMTMMAMAWGWARPWLIVRRNSPLFILTQTGGI